jgi:hypothetical protein
MESLEQLHCNVFVLCLQEVECLKGNWTPSTICAVSDGSVYTQFYKIKNFYNNNCRHQTRLTPVALKLFQLRHSTIRPPPPPFSTRTVAAATTATLSISCCYLHFHPPVVLYVPAQSNVSLVSLRIHRHPPIYLPSPVISGFVRKES